MSASHCVRASRCRSLRGWRGSFPLLVGDHRGCVSLREKRRLLISWSAASLAPSKRGRGAHEAGTNGKSAHDEGGLERRGQPPPGRIEIQRKNGHRRGHKRHAEGAKHDWDNSPWYRDGEECSVEHVHDRSTRHYEKSDSDGAFRAPAMRHATSHQRTDHDSCDHRNKKPRERCLREPEDPQDEDRGRTDVNKESGCGKGDGKGLKQKSRVASHHCVVLQGRSQVQRRSPCERQALGKLQRAGN